LSATAAFAQLPLETLDQSLRVTKTYRNAPGTVGGGVDRTTFVAD
jgi:hypothetical protein